MLIDWEQMPGEGWGLAAVLASSSWTAFKQLRRIILFFYAFTPLRSRWHATERKGSSSYVEEYSYDVPRTKSCTVRCDPGQEALPRGGRGLSNLLCVGGGGNSSSQPAGVSFTSGATSSSQIRGPIHISTANQSAKSTQAHHPLWMLLTLQQKETGYDWMVGMGL